MSWSQLAELQLQLVDLVGQLGAGQLYCTVLYCTAGGPAGGGAAVPGAVGAAESGPPRPPRPQPGHGAGRPRAVGRSHPAAAGRQVTTTYIFIETSLCSIEIVDQMCVKDATYGDIDNRGWVINLKTDK